MTSPTRREDLLHAAVDYVTAQGLSEISLRQLADALGTSHRMLIHYFGSKDELWAAIIGEVERRQLQLFAQFSSAGDGSVGAQLRAWWQHISDPALWPAERLFFEVYAQALQGRVPATGALRSLIDPWLDAAQSGAQALGLDENRARAMARLGLAVTRGLLLDLLATGDTAGADAAMEEWIRLFEHGLGPDLKTATRSQAAAATGVATTGRQ